MNVVGFKQNKLHYPLVSVILPVRNAANFLSEAIESILKQTLSNFELIIVYDKSDDASFDIVKKFQKSDSRIKLVYGENNSLIGALNIGLLAAKGKFIARMDADDISLPDRFAVQVKNMELNNADICGSHFYIVGPTSNLLGAKLVPVNQDQFIAYLATTVPFAHGSVMIRTSFIRKHELLYGPSGCSEDYKLWVSFFNKGAIFSNCDNFLFKYRDTKHSLSKRFKKTSANDAKLISKEFIEKNYDQYYKAVSRLIVDYGYLSNDAKKILLLGTFSASIIKRNTIFFKVLAKSGLIPFVLFLYNLLK